MLGANSDGIEQNQLNILVDAEIDSKGLVFHHINTFNEMINEGIPQIVEEGFKVELSIHNERVNTPEDQEIEDIKAEVVFSNVQIKNPMHTLPKKDSPIPMTPSMARHQRLNYTGIMCLDVHIKAEAYGKNGNLLRVMEGDLRNHAIAKIPIMVRSNRCNTEKLSKLALREIGEDPLDEGGYFIISGRAWSIDIMESRTLNQPHIFYNLGYANEVVRFEFISKPGDAFENSKQLMMFLLTNDNIMIEITDNKFKGVKIPFYIIFRVLGVKNDKEIADMITFGEGLGKQRRMANILNKAFRAPNKNFKEFIDLRDRTKLISDLSEKLVQLYMIGSSDYKDKAKAEANSIEWLKANMLSILDKGLLPHIGLDKTSRNAKMRYLGYLINRMLLVEHHIVESTLRDSLKNKRMKPAGLSYATIFKTQFNLIVIQAIRKKLKSDFETTTFSSVQLEQSVRSSIQSEDLERGLAQSIVVGDKKITVKNQTVPNRLSSQQLHTKNQTNIVHTLCTIRAPTTSSSNASERERKMRQVDPSFTGMICPVDSPHTGKPVGLTKNKAITSSICNAQNSQVIKAILLQDELVIPLNKVKILETENYSKVFVTGDWIGCTPESHVLVNKYRKLRRLSFMGNDTKINSLVTIYLDKEVNDIHFWTDAGRMLRPIIPVLNNKDNPELFGSKYNEKTGKGFIQDIVIEPKHVAGLMKKELTIVDLQKAGVIEYISAEEQENCLIAEDLDYLKKNKDNPLLQFTHCEVPVSLLGVVALIAPFTEHNAIVRVVYEVSQANQTSGWATLNWADRIDKSQFIQYICEYPLAKTITSKYLYPNGVNVKLAIATSDGWNQEDAVTFNKASIDRGIFAGFQASEITTEKGKNEIFGDIDEAITEGIKSRASYEKLVNGIVREGTIINPNDVVIAKSVIVTPGPGSHYTRRDKSIIYNGPEPAIVVQVIESVNQNHDKFITVKYKSLREPSIGNKFSSRVGQKSTISMIFRQSDMWRTESGAIPDVIMNPHAIPSRMTIGQLLEGVLGKISAIKGCISDCTIFSKIDAENLCDQLEELGFERHGYERVYNGKTGEMANVELFVTPIYYQGLQKFAVEAIYAIANGRTDVITRQYLDGKANRGGLRIGEMEKDCMMAHGAVMMYMQKALEDCDLFYMYVCKNCCKRAIVNTKTGMYRCLICKDAANIVRVKSKYSSNLFMHELNAMGIGMKLGIKPFRYEVN